MKKIINLFKPKEEKNFWRNAFFTILIFNYIVPSMLPVLLMLQIGLITPELDQTTLNNTINNASIQLAESYTNVMYKMVTIGQNTAKSSPFSAKVWFYGISSIIVSVYVALVILFLKFSRHIIYLILNVKNWKISKKIIENIEKEKAKKQKKIDWGKLD